MTDPQKIDIPHRGFESRAPLGVEQLPGGILWRTTHDLIYHDGTWRTFCVPAGYETDFATVPRAFWAFVPKSGQHNPAAILHDHLCDEAVAGRFRRRDADWLFREALASLGVQPTRRWVMWAGTRWGSLPSGWRDLIRDLPTVLPLSLLALVAAPAAITTQLTLWPVIAAWEAVERRFITDTTRRQETVMTWSDKLGDLRTLLEELDSRLDAAHEDIDSRIEAAHAKAAEAIRIAQTLLDALTPDTDTEIPA